MNSIFVNFTGGFIGRAKGTPSGAATASPLRTSALGLSLSSSGTGASLASNAFGPQTRTLTHATSETHDWQNFTNTLNELAQSFGTALRFFYLVHSTDSDASSITVGAAGAGEWTPFSWPVGTTMTLLPGEGFVLLAATATGLPVSGAKHLFKVACDDLTNDATYEIGCFGA